MNLLYESLVNKVPVIIQMAKGFDAKGVVCGIQRKNNSDDNEDFYITIKSTENSISKMYFWFSNIDVFRFI